jgi:hypothetical protein
MTSTPAGSPASLICGASIHVTNGDLIRAFRGHELRGAGR